jgi:hypothetical protein
MARPKRTARANNAPAAKAAKKKKRKYGSTGNRVVDRYLRWQAKEDSKTSKTLKSYCANKGSARRKLRSTKSVRKAIKKKCGKGKTCVCPYKTKTGKSTRKHCRRKP